MCWALGTDGAVLGIVMSCVGHCGMGTFVAVFWALQGHVLGTVELGPPVPCVEHHSAMCRASQDRDHWCHVLSTTVPCFGYCSMGTSSAMCWASWCHVLGVTVPCVGMMDGILWCHVSPSHKDTAGDTWAELTPIPWFWVLPYGSTEVRGDGWCPISGHTRSPAPGSVLSLPPSPPAPVSAWRQRVIVPENRSRGLFAS